MAIVYRVEHPRTNEGPFRDGGIWLHTDKDYNTSARYPGPINDPGIERDMEPWEVCATENLYMLNHWFGRDSALVAWLEEEGFMVFEMEAEECTHGRFQSLIKRETAKIINAFLPSDVLVTS